MTAVCWPPAPGTATVTSFYDTLLPFFPHLLLLSGGQMSGRGGECRPGTLLPIGLHRLLPTGQTGNRSAPPACSGFIPRFQSVFACVPAHSQCCHAKTEVGWAVDLTLCNKTESLHGDRVAFSLPKINPPVCAQNLVQLLLHTPRGTRSCRTESPYPSPRQQKWCHSETGECLQ